MAPEPAGVLEETAITLWQAETIQESRRVRVPRTGALKGPPDARR